MKLIIQIPCYDEADTLGITLDALPRQVPGFETVEWLIIDDGSNDQTAEVAQRHGVDHILRHSRNLGLARAYSSGLAACLHHGADIIVNTDADNQYDARDIPALTAPVLTGQAELVIGSRPIEEIAHFSPLKKRLQRLGSLVVRLASGTQVEDATSGFRAISRTAAQRLVVISKYSYTLETIVQAGQHQMTVATVPVRVNPDLRPSRLMRGITGYIWRSTVTIIRIFVIYRPFRFFASIGALLFGLGFLIGLRFLWFYVSGSSSSDSDRPPMPLSLASARSN